MKQNKQNKQNKKIIISKGPEKIKINKRKKKNIQKSK